ncbi:cyclic pyranopterin monophosphate synthase MoaC [Mucilaginibacter ginkgonis]|uniref:cyclic pyranopterin monophosphate synthase n=1 Tax=Mucilaginibacter ginkgonis TaxID=2682091 RepID=A0A6I4I1K9_9SPHI|nr:cyclic pyranopterin monophosphate synthase MoaC [Mucilaginibacter ginkgonis]
MSQFSHIDERTNQPGMVDVGDKQTTKRIAIAQSTIWIGTAVMALLLDDEIFTKKGPVFQTAIIAGTMAVKKTSDLIPLCHPLPVDAIKFDITTNDEDVIITCTVSVLAKTGVEMEALTGACVAALTVYDMCKAVSHDMVIKETRLLRKTGGKSDYQAR